MPEDFLTHDERQWVEWKRGQPTFEYSLQVIERLLSALAQARASAREAVFVVLDECLDFGESDFTTCDDFTYRRWRLFRENLEKNLRSLRGETC